MESKHTPGPWVSTEDQLGHYVIDSEQNVVGCIFRERDIALITAAPELFESAKRLLNCPSPVRQGEAEFKALKAAVAKAEGKGDQA